MLPARGEFKCARPGRGCGELTERFIQWSSEATQTSRAQLIESSVVAYQLVGHLAELGVSPALVLSDRDVAPPDWTSLRVAAASTVSLWVTYLPDARVDPQAQLGTMVNGLHSLSARGLPGVAMVIMGDRLRAQVAVHTPQLLGSTADDVIIPCRVTGRLSLPASDMETGDVIGRVLAPGGERPGADHGRRRGQAVDVTPREVSDRPSNRELGRGAGKSFAEHPRRAAGVGAGVQAVGQDLAGPDPGSASQDDLAVLHGHLVGPDRPFASGAVPVGQPERVVVQRAHHLLAVDEAVGEWTTAVRADRLQRVQPATAGPEHGHLLVADGEGPSFADRDLLGRPQSIRLQPPGLQPAGRRPAHRTGTFGNSISGNASRNWPSVTGF